MAQRPINLANSASGLWGRYTRHLLVVAGGLCLAVDTAGATRWPENNRPSLTPIVTITPGGPNVGATKVTLTVQFCDSSRPLEDESWSVQVTNATIFKAFVYTPGGGGTQAAAQLMGTCTYSGTATGTIWLTPGVTATVQASILNTWDQLGTVTRTYNYVPDDPPTITFSPTGGTFSNTALPVTITWSDDIGLYTGTHSILLNGANVTSHFDYVPSGTSATSTGTITLQPGSNTLSASVCDTAVQCTGATATYVYSRVPDVTIQPPGGTYLTPARSVNITWADDIALNSATRLITFNGANVTGSFTYTGTATSASSTGSVNLQLGVNTLTARICDLEGACSPTKTASYTYDPNAQEAAMMVDVASVNPGTSADRALCLSISLGENSAAECGDLRVTHALPVTFQYGKRRQPVLIYNSGLAQPRPHVQANLTLPTTAPVPDSVTATLRVDNVIRATRKWPGNHWSTGEVRRIAIGFDAATDSTGVKPYTLEVRNYYNGLPPFTAVASGQLPVVNRGKSYFGAGWWIAGLEQLYPATMTWVGGDGSVRKYTLINSTKWAAANVTAPDTIKYEGGQYVRYLKGGTRIYFDGNGQHVRTLPPLGTTHETSFVYQSGKLTSITMQAPNSGAKTYTLAYPTSPAPKVTITAPAAPASRVTELLLSSGKVTAISDPDGRSTAFQYSGSRITKRTSRDTVNTWFDYDPASFKLKASRLDMGGGSWIADTLSFLESHLLVQAADPNVLRVLVNGPRTDIKDTTGFYLDRFGAPRKIVNALGDSTVLLRAHATFPGLVTAAIQPNGFREDATYNARGNLTTRTAIAPLGPGSQNAVTRYEYKDPLWPDFPTSIVAPLGDSIAMGYDGTTGNRLWQQNRRGSTSRIEFRYYSGNWHGLPRAYGPTGQPADSIAYTTAGARIATRTPLGAWSYFYKDAAGRDTMIVMPVEGASTQKQFIEYNAVDQVVETRTVGPAATAWCTGCSMPAMDSSSINVAYDLDVMGRPLHVLRTINPVSAGVDLIETTYTYDNAGRRLTEENMGVLLRTAYDPAGNPIRRINARGDTIRMTYDAVGRLTDRIVPQVDYPQLQCDFGDIDLVPCVTGAHFEALTIPADTVRMTYDNTGLRSALNRSALVRRSYYPNGLLKTDSLALFHRDTAYTGEPPIDPEFVQSFSDPDSVVYTLTYGIGYTYDRNGRRTAISYPTEVSSTGAGYTYLTWGALDQVTGVTGETYQFGYDAQGRVASITYPAATGLIERFTYDPDGRRSRRQVGTSSQPTSLYNDTLTYDARGKIKRADVRKTGRVFEQWYSGLGHLVASRWHSTSGTDFKIDEFRLDAHGNTYRSRKKDPVNLDPDYTHWYDGFGRLTEIRAENIQQRGGTNSFRSYDLDGNVSLSADIPHTVGTGEVSRAVTRSYYDAEGRLVFLQRFSREYVPGTVGNDDLKETTRYDALGRRVVVHTQHLPQPE